MSTLKYQDEINHTMQGELLRSVYYNGNQLIPFNIVIALAWLVLSAFFVSDLSAEVWFIFRHWPILCAGCTVTFACGRISGRTSPAD